MNKAGRMVAQMMVVMVLLANAQASGLDETPGRPGEWGFRPADGSTVETNPPALTWRPQKDAGPYRIEVRSAGGGVVYAQP